MKKRSHIDHLLDGQHSAIGPFTNIQLEIQLIDMGLEEYLKMFLFISDHARVFSYRIEFSHPSVTRISILLFIPITKLHLSKLIIILS